MGRVEGVEDCAVVVDRREEGIVGAGAWADGVEDGREVVTGGWRRRE